MGCGKLKKQLPIKIPSCYFLDSNSRLGCAAGPGAAERVSTSGIHEPPIPASGRISAPGLSRTITGEHPRQSAAAETMADAEYLERTWAAIHSKVEASPRSRETDGSQPSTLRNRVLLLLRPRTP